MSDPEKRRTWLAANRDRLRAYQREYHAAHRAERNAQARAHRQTLSAEKLAHVRALAAARGRKRWANPSTQERMRSVRRENRLAERGLTGLAVQRMLRDQGCACAICNGVFAFDRKFPFVIDHSHASGAVRGLLCTNCNVAIGHLRDNPVIVRAAAAYLERNGSS